MKVIGWVIWGLVCIFALQYIFISLQGLRGKLPYGYKSSFYPLMLKLGPLGGILVSLYITVGWDISKLHLLWLVPASYGVTYTVLPLLFGLVAFIKRDLLEIILKDNIAIIAFDRVLKTIGVTRRKKSATIVAALVCPPFLLLILAYGLVNLCWFCVEWCIRSIFKKRQENKG